MRYPEENLDDSDSKAPANSEAVCILCSQHHLLLLSDFAGSDYSRIVSAVEDRSIRFLVQSMHRQFSPRLSAFGRAVSRMHELLRGSLRDCPKLVKTELAIMDSTWSQALPTGGLGCIEATVFGSCSTTISALSSAYPVRLISPSSLPGERAALVFILTHGGGLVAGDNIYIRAAVRRNARLGLLTRGSTKIYKSLPSLADTTQSLTVSIEENAALLVLPDPVQPFRDSVYRQIQTFEIDPRSSSMLLLDWVSEGRTAMGEKWCLSEWKGRNEIWSRAEQPDGKGKKLLLRDNTKLHGDPLLFAQALNESMGHLGVFGTMIIRGPLFEELGRFFLKQYARQPRIGEKHWSTSSDTNSAICEAGTTLRGTKEGFMWTAATIRQFVIVRFGAVAVEDARQWLRSMLLEEGTVEREFGRRYLLCLEDR